METQTDCTRCEHATLCEDWDEAGMEACGGIAPQRVTYYDCPFDHCVMEDEE